jgi:hypothetical protein
MPASPTTYPLDGPTIGAGGQVTVDELLRNPSRIDRDIVDMAMIRMYMDRVFTAAGGVEGGALLFERPNAAATDLYGDREPKEIAPGTEFPEQTFQRGVPMMARPKKIGNKIFVTKEANKRNNPRTLARDIKKASNTITRRVELMGLAELAAVVTAEGRFRTGTSWGTYAGLTAANRTYTSGPVADIMAALGQADTEERGVEYDSIILNTNEALKVKQAYPEMTLNEVFALANDASGQGTQGGIRNVFVTSRHQAGVATVFEAGNVGEWRNEFPFESESEWEGPASGGRQRWVYQWSISPLFAVDNQFAILEIRGIA